MVHPTCPFQVLERGREGGREGERKSEREGEGRKEGERRRGGDTI